MITDDGVIIRIQADSIRLCARPSKGVLLMRIGSDSKVVTIAQAPHEEPESEDPQPDSQEETQQEPSQKPASDPSPADPAP